MNTKSQYPLSVIMSILFPVSFFVGCSSEDPVEPDLREIKFAATLPYETRVTNNQWDLNDAIGVSIYNNSISSFQRFHDNVKLVANKAGNETDFISQNSQEIAIPIGEPSFKILAYYPYDERNRFLGWYQVIEDQTKSNLDYLLANEILDGKQSVCDLNFKHILTRLELVFIPGSGVTLDEVKNGVYTITNTLRGDYRIIAENENAGAIEIGSRILRNWEISKYGKVEVGSNSMKITLLLIPSDDENINLKANVKGKELSCSFPVSLTAGVSQTVNIKVEDSRLGVRNFYIQEWNTNPSDYIFYK